MKEIATFLFLLISIPVTFAQSETIDATLQKILTVKNDNDRVDKLFVYLSSVSESDPLITLQIAKKLLVQSQKNKDKLAETFAISQLGYQSITTGNRTKSLQYALKSLKMAEQTGNFVLLAIVYNRLAHNYGLDLNKKKELYAIGLETANKTGNFKIQEVCAANLGNTCLQMNKPDSALFYLQKAEQLSFKANFSYNSSFIFSTLGNTYAKMNKPTLAIAYFNIAVKEAQEQKAPRSINSIYSSIAKYYYEVNQRDSSVAYAKKAIAIVQNTPFSNNVMPAAKILMDIYRNKNNDLAMKYSDIYRIANDSVNNLKSIQETQLMSFEEDLRQHELASKKIAEEDDRKTNIQYALIAMGIVTFITLFFLLSRSIIVTEKWISFFGILGLLIVFEFVNLFIHPFLQRVTHSSPILMLLALVAIASLLIPLHHRIEKWVKEKMTGKNKAIRLANAKKTIEQLEGENK